MLKCNRQRIKRHKLSYQLHKKERPTNCMHAVSECGKDETKRLRNSSIRKQTTDANAKRTVTTFDSQQGAISYSTCNKTSYLSYAMRNVLLDCMDVKRREQDHEMTRFCNFLALVTVKTTQRLTS